ATTAEAAASMQQEPEVEAFRASLDEQAHEPDAGFGEEMSGIDDLPAAEIHPIHSSQPVPGTAQASGLAEFSQPADEEEPVVSSSPEPAWPQEQLAPLSQPVEVENRPAIISDSTGRQVAAAFGELSEAFAASRRRSFDEMAQEMLRPMLQDWLDNNLPTLVEKLVREEIERVARGGQG